MWIAVFVTCPQGKTSKQMPKCKASVPQVNRGQAVMGAQKVLKETMSSSHSYSLPKAKSQILSKFLSSGFRFTELVKRVDVVQ